MGCEGGSRLRYRTPKVQPALSAFSLAEINTRIQPASRAHPAPRTWCGLRQSRRSETCSNASRSACACASASARRALTFSSLSSWRGCSLQHRRQDSGRLGRRTWCERRQEDVRAPVQLPTRVHAGVLPAPLILSYTSAPIPKTAATQSWGPLPMTHPLSPWLQAPSLPLTAPRPRRPRCHPRASAGWAGSATRPPLPGGTPC